MNWSYEEIYNTAIEKLRATNTMDNMNLGAETQSQNKANREYMDRFFFETRLMGSQWADPSIELFGKKLPSPIICSAVCYGRLLGSLAGYSDHYLDSFARGLKAADTIMGLGMIDPPFMQSILDQQVDFMMFVKPFATSRDESDYIRYCLKDAESRGAIAVGTDITVFYGEKTRDENPLRYPFGPQSMEQLASYREVTKLPFIIKGVLSVQDALKAKEIGADAIIVSNHGGESIDYAVPILKILPEIRKAVPDMKILVDSGFQRGTDILKALALGADCVCVTTILLLAYAAYGEQGVTRMMQILTDELKRNMSLTGCSDVNTIPGDILHFV